jgi:gluconolactonase
MTIFVAGSPKPPEAARFAVGGFRTMFVGLPTVPTEIFARLPDEFRLAHVETEWSRSRGGGGLHSFLEGPAFDGDGTLWCVDLAHGRIFRVSPTGDWTLFHQYSGRPNGLKIGPDGRIIVTDQVNGILSFDPRTAEMRVLLAEYAGRRLQGPNDLTFAANGDLYFTDPGDSDLRRREGRVFRIRATGEVELLLDGLAYPNGLVLSPEQDVLYIAITRSLQVLRLALRPDVVGEHKCGVFLQLSGGIAGPDGMAVDSVGNLFVAHSGLATVWQFDRLGEPLARFRSCAGIRTTNLALGPDGVSAFITESETGVILRARVPLIPPP